MLPYINREISALGLLPADTIRVLTAEGLLDGIEAYFRSLSSKDRLEYGHRLLDTTGVSIPNSVNPSVQFHRNSSNPPTAYFVPGPISLDLNLRLDASRNGFHVGEVSISGGGVGLKAKTAAEFGIKPVFFTLGKSCLEADVFQAWANSIGGVTYVGEGAARVVPHISVRLEDGRVLGPAVLVPELELTDQEGTSLVELVSQKLLDVRNDPKQRFFVINGRHAFPGLEPDYYRKLIQMVKDKGFLPVVDFRLKMSVEEMEALYLAGPWMATPNLAEFEKFLQKDQERPLDLQRTDVKRLMQLAYQVAKRYHIAILVITLDERGAVAVFRDGQSNSQGAYVPAPDHVDVVSAVGAGDAFSGAFLGKWICTENDFVSSLVTAVAAGAATTTLQGSNVAQRKLIEVYKGKIMEGEIEQFRLPLSSEILGKHG